MLTLAAIIPVFHQVEEVMEMKQEVLVEMITSATSAGESWSITQGSCRCAGVGGAENSPVPNREAKGQARAACRSLGSAPLKRDQVPQGNVGHPGGRSRGERGSYGDQYESGSIFKNCSSR